MHRGQFHACATQKFHPAVFNRMQHCCILIAGLGRLSCISWSGRTMARIGLRMMPPFPWFPLSSVRRVFPSTAGRLAFQVVPFPHVAQVKPAPGIPCAALGLRLPFVHSVASSGAPLGVGTMDSVMHRHSRSWLPYPRGPRSGLGCSVPVHPRLFDLIRPTRRHIPISPHGDLYGMPSLCWCA